MKTFKRIQAMFLAVVMAVMTIGATTAFAAESSVHTELSSQAVSPASIVTIVNQSFDMTGSHRGATRTYNYSGIGFTCQFTDQNGKQLSDGTILAVRLYNASTGELVREWQSSNGAIIVASPTLSINKGGRYYFQYMVAYGTQNLNIRMHIYTS